MLPLLDLDSKYCNWSDEMWNEVKQKAASYMTSKGYDKGKNSKFKIGDTVEFNGGYSNDIRYRATIKGIDNNDLYVFNDSYWYPIQDTPERNIVIIR